MNQSYLKVLGQIVNLLNDVEMDATTDDSGEGSCEYVEVEGNEVCVNDDHEREQWYTNFEFDGPQDDYKEIFIKVFGEPEKVHTGVHSYDVLNWTIDGNLIVLGNSGVEVFRDYKKV